MSEMRPIAAAESSPSLTLIVPGLEGSCARHWQSAWESEDPACRRVELGHWDRPDPGSWMHRLTEAVAARNGHDITFVAHSLGCILIAWWAHCHPQQARHIAAAMLVAPCDPLSDRDLRLRPFAPVPARRLPFPTIVVASRDDPYAGFDWSADFARTTGAELHDAGHLGHINVASGVGAWPQGRAILGTLRSRAATRLISIATPMPRAGRS